MTIIGFKDHNKRRDNRYLTAYDSGILIELCHESWPLYQRSLGWLLLQNVNLAESKTNARNFYEKRLTAPLFGSNLKGFLQHYCFGWENYDTTFDFKFDAFIESTLAILALLGLVIIHVEIRFKYNIILCPLLVRGQLLWHSWQSGRFWRQRT